MKENDLFQKNIYNETSEIFETNRRDPSIMELESDLRKF